MTQKTHKRIVIISMYKGLSGRGLQSLVTSAKAHGDYVGTVDVRLGEALPSLNDFDVLLSSGGPGDPTELGSWGQAYADLIEAIHRHNQNHPDAPKRAFLICHSFQVMSHYWGLGEISKRSSALWGIHAQMPDTLSEEVVPVFPTETFYALESRFYQIQPTHDIAQRCDELGVVIAARDVDGALTAWQTVDGHMAAVQFHPEAQIEPVTNLLNNPPVADSEPIHMCPPAMRDVTQTRLHMLPATEQILVDFITRIV